MLRGRTFFRFGVWAIACGAAAAQVTSRVSVATGGVQANDSCRGGTISDDGRFVAFFSRASTLVPGDTNAKAGPPRASRTNTSRPPFVAGGFEHGQGATPATPGSQ